MSPLLWNQNPAGYINDNPLFRMTGYYGRLLSKEGFSSLISIITLWTSELLRYHLMASSFWSFGSAIFAFAVAAGLTIITGVYRRRLYFLMEYTSSLIWCIFVGKNLILIIYFAQENRGVYKQKRFDQRRSGEEMAETSWLVKRGSGSWARWRWELF